MKCFKSKTITTSWQQKKKNNKREKSKSKERSLSRCYFFAVTIKIIGQLNWKTTGRASNCGSWIAFINGRHARYTCLGLFGVCILFVCMCIFFNMCVRHPGFAPSGLTPIAPKQQIVNHTNYQSFCYIITLHIHTSLQSYILSYYNIKLSSTTIINLRYTMTVIFDLYFYYLLYQFKEEEKEEKKSKNIPVEIIKTKLIIYKLLENHFT